MMDTCRHCGQTVLMPDELTGVIHTDGLYVCNGGKGDTVAELDSESPRKRTHTKNRGR